MLVYLKVKTVRLHLEIILPDIIYFGLALFMPIVT